VYCDRRCRADFERSTTERPTRYKQAGYWMLRWNVGGRYRYQFEHRFVWEQHNGPVPDGYVVHHRNEDKSDNRIDNLELMLRSEHTRLHHRDTEQYPDGATAAEYQRAYRQRHGDEYRARHAAAERERRRRNR
jgi:hypothetical protein